MSSYGLLKISSSGAPTIFAIAVGSVVSETAAML